MPRVNQMKQMRELREQGHSLQAIGHEFGLSRERVRQLVVKHFGTSRIPMPSRYKVAKLLGINWYHLKHWERQGLLNPIHYNGEYRYYYPQSEIEKARELSNERQRRYLFATLRYQ